MPGSLAVGQTDGRRNDRQEGFVLAEILKAVLFGVVEGITEWLPISSTGHMILLEEFVQLEVTPEFWSMFLVVIQLGAIMAVVMLYWNRIFPFRFGGSSLIRKDVFSMWVKVVVGCIPAVIIGLPFDDLFEELFYNYWSIAIALIVFGIAFIVIENRNRRQKPRMKTIGQITLPVAFIIGIFQLIAGIFPGTSRSGSTIVGALLLGVSRTAAAEFTFFMAIPVMFGASLLKIVKFAMEGVEVSGMEWGILATGCVVAFLVSVFVIRFLMDYIKRHNFKVFAWYRIVLGVLVLAYFMLVH